MADLATAGGVHVRRAALRFEDCALTVGSTDEADLRWLSAFLAGSFEEVPASAGDRHVELVVDPAAYDRRLRLGTPGGGALAEGFAKDSEPALLERWPSSRPGHLFRDTRGPLFYEVSDDARRVEILARERTRKARTALMRVVRELAMDRVVATGGLLVHGAAVATAEGTVVLSGPRRSGKTTLLIALLQAPGTRYVSNDRCVVRVGKGGASVRGLPTLVSIRGDTLGYFPEIRRRLAVARPDLAQRDPRASFSLDPPEFCELVGGSPREPGGPLRALCFPQVTDAPERLALRRLEASDALERLRRGLFRAAYASPLGEAFVSPGHRPRVPPADVQRWLAEHVPCFECRLGGGAPPGPGECVDLLAAVTA